MQTAQIISQKLFNLLKVGVFFVLLTPIVIIPNMNFPYVLSKALFFQILVEILLGIYIFLILIDKNKRPQKNIIAYSLIFYLLALIISTILSVDKYHSFWGGVQWHNGLFFHLHLAAFFLILTVFKNKKHWFDFFKANLIVGAIVIFGALLQKLGLIFTGVPRASSMTGNPTFLASYLIFILFFSFYIFLVEKNLHWRVFSLLVFVLGLPIFILTQTRGAYIGLMAGVAISFLVYLFFYAPKQHKRKLILLLILFLIIAGLMTFVYIQKTQVDFSRQRNIQTRLICWSVSLRAWTEHAVFGWGPENFYIGFNKYFDPEYLVWTTNGGLHYEAALNFPHNKLIEVLLLTGILGLLAYLSIFATAIYQLIKNRFKNSKFEFVVIAGLLSAYFVQNLFLFDYVLSFLMFIFSLAYIYIHYSAEKEIENQVKEKITAWKIIAGIIVCFALCFVLYIGNLKPLMASFYSNDAYQYEKKQNVHGFYDSIQKADKLNTYLEEEIATELEPLTAKLIKANADNPKAQEYYYDSLNIIEEYKNHHPLLLNAYLQLAELYASGQNLNPENLQKSEELLKQAIDLAPNRPETYIHLAQNYIYQEKDDLALDYFNQAIQINPDFYIPQLILGRAYDFWEMEDEKISQFKLAIDLGYKGAPEIKQVANYFYDNDDLETAKKYYQLLIEYYPDNESYKAIYQSRVKEALK